MRLVVSLLLSAATVAAPALAAEGTSLDVNAAAAAFGALEGIHNMSLSPDGTKVSYVEPASGQGNAIRVMNVAKDAAPVRVAVANGKPERLTGCDWVSEERLVCKIRGIVDGGGVLLPMGRTFAINADGTALKLLGKRQNPHTRGVALNDGDLLDFLPGQPNAVLMTRQHLPDDRIGSRLGSDIEGLGVDRVDTLSLSSTTVEAPKSLATEYISDGRGQVRIMGLRKRISATDLDSGVISYHYRQPGSRDWKPLGEFNGANGMGFNPYAVDAARNIAYGLKKKDGRFAAYAVALDGSLREDLLYADPHVDVDGFIQVGRDRRVVGASFTTEVRQAIYFDPALKGLVASLSKALPDLPQIRIADSSIDGQRLLIWAGSDKDAGVYYVLDRRSKELKTLLSVRPELDGVRLAEMRPVSYSAADGTMIPAYLTLPVGSSGKNLPAIVMPHGGPSARDEWGFDWLVQFFASQGFAVLQPNFRGSSGYGDSWFRDNGFKSWRTAIGDVSDGGRWLAKQGIAAPDKLAIFGWSYGGYAALQSAATSPELFKAVVAVAPVTDLNMLRQEWADWSNYKLVSDFIGHGAHVREGAPTENAAKITAPVLLFHGEMDRNVGVRQSRAMADRLRDAGKKVELVTWTDLDHQLEDGSARAAMLKKADAFLRITMRMADK